MSSASSYANLVQDLYVAYFGRPADYFGLQNFEAALAAANAPTDPAALATAYSTNSAVKSLVDAFGTSAESAALYGSGTTESFVNAIFENLFNRPAAVAGLTFWVDAINSGTVSKGDAALAILAGAEGNTTTQGKADWALIGAKIGVANDFTTALGSSSTQIVAYSGAAAAQDARLMLAGVSASTDPTTFDVQTTINNIVAGNNQHSFDLTTGVDTLTGGTGNNVFNAILDNTTGVSHGGQAATLQSFDTITGGTLNNTLNITDFGMSSYMGIPTGATITGITTLNINSLEGIAASTSFSWSTTYANSLDVSGWTNLTALNVSASNAYYDLLKAGSKTAINLSTSGSAEYVLTWGGSTVNWTNTSTSDTYGYITGGATTSSVSITDKGIYQDNYIYDQHNSYDKGFNGSGSTPGWSAGTNTIATFSATGQDDDSYNYIYSDALTTLNLTGDSYSEYYVYAAAGTRTLTLNLNNIGNSTVYTNEYVYVYDNTATTVAVNASGAAVNGLYFDVGAAKSLTFSDAVNVAFYDGTNVGGSYLEAASATKVTITGAGAFTADLSDLGTGAVIDASGSAGVVTVNMASAAAGDATQSFTGGTGQDVVTVGVGQTGTVTGGSATNNEIVLYAATATPATQANLAAYTHFSILGVAGSISGTFDMSKLTNGSGYTHFDVQHSGGNVTFTNVAQGSTISLEGGNTNVVTLQTADSSGATDSTTVSLGTTSAVGATYTQVTLEDSINVGTGTLNLVSNVKASNSTNHLTSLYDYNWVTLNVSGTGYLDIGTSNVHSASLTINNTAVSHTTTSLTVATLNDNYLTSLTFAGSEGTYITNLNSTSTTMTMVDNSTSGVTINTLGDTALTKATFTDSVNTTSSWFNINNSISEPALATLNLNGNVSLYVVGDAVTTGITVTGGTDNAEVQFTSTGATASGATDSVTLGNGSSDAVTLGAGVAGSTQTVVLGSGAHDSVTSTSVGAVTVTVGSSTTGTDSITANSAATFHVTAGNGTNVISDTAATAATTITVGTGANTITVGNTAAGTITVGAHLATVADSITLGYSNSTTTSVTGMEKIAGLNNVGVDSLVFSGDAAAITAMTQITASAVSALGGDTTLLSDWIATASGKGGAVTANTVAWFQYQGNTYLVDLTAADTGHLTANDTVVELTGTGYTFAKTTFTGGNGHVNLLG